MPSSSTILDRSPDLLRPEAVSDAATAADVVVVGVRGSGDGLTLCCPPEGFPADVVTAALRAVGAGGKVGSTTRVPAPDGVSASSLVAVGLGTDADESPSDESLRRAAGSAARAARGTGTVLVALGTDRVGEIALGAALGSYVPAKVTGKDGSAAGATGSTGDAPAEGSDTPDRLLVLTDGSAGSAAAVERAGHVAEHVCLARDLVNTPPNLLFPASFADRAAHLATEAGLEVEVLDESALAEGGYGGILGVGQGSSRPPRLVRLTHRAADGRPSVALVGKGVTFDTGGISIKPAAGMEKMTMDMGGAAAVVATVLLAARLQLDVTVTATVPMAENMPSATAYRPGDVLTMYGGTTVEVLNTDAEGRLILADAIVRACEDRPDYLVDTATLTGAQMVALGMRTPGVMGHDDFRDRVAELSQGVGEGGWPMPLPEEIRDGLDSVVADLANVTHDRWGGMLAAGLFLQEFVAEGVRWAHVDVAGPAFHDSGATGYLAKGGTGVPVRTMLAVLEDVAARG